MKSPFKRIRSRPGSASYSRQASNRAPCGSLIDMLRFARPVPVPPESSLWDLIEQKTGHTLSKEHFANWEHRKEKEHRQRIAVMRALGKAGRQNLHAEQDTIAIVGLMSGHAEPVVKTPRWSCFSWVARAQRRELLTNLAFYLAHRPECRHLRITLGPRVPLEEIGNALRSLAKAISRLNTRPWFREKAEIVARSCELTWNGATAHVHAHIVVRPLREVAEADWIALEGRVRGHCRGDIGSFEPLGDSRGSSKLMMIMDSITESGKVPGEGATVMRQSGAQPHRASVLLPCRKRRSGYYQVPRGTKQAAW
jgi:hypothetical protein